MLRALFLAIGISLGILGGECLVVEKAVFAAPLPASSDEASAEKGAPTMMGGRRDFSPPDWAPWSLMSAGAVVMLYSFTVPRRVAA